MKMFYYLSKLLKKIQIPAIKSSKIDSTSRVCSKSHIVVTSLGKYSYIGNSCTVINTEIGKYCSIADNCIIGGASHPIEWGSTSPVFYQGENIMNKNFSNHNFISTKKTKIGNDVWLGNNCIVKSGISIGNGAVIGMGSVVTKDVGPYEIWAGNPAKMIRRRFNQEQINKLNESEWWKLDDSVLADKAKYINDIEKFIESVGEVR